MAVAFLHYSWLGFALQYRITGTATPDQHTLLYLLALPRRSALSLGTRRSSEAPTSRTQKSMELVSFLYEILAIRVGSILGINLAQKLNKT